ncbi:MAG: phosphatase PAP2 family protein [Pseudoxanthomonas sp.]
MSLTACGGGDDSSSSSSDSSSYTVPDAPSDPDYVDSAPVDTSVTAFVDTYYTNVTGDACHATEDTNAGVRLLRGFLDIWDPISHYTNASSSLSASTDEDTGAACAAVASSGWDGEALTGGTIKNESVLYSAIDYVVSVTNSRTDARVEAAWIDSITYNYNIAEGIGRLLDTFRKGLGNTYTFDYSSHSYSTNDDATDTLDDLTTLISEASGDAGSSKSFYKFARPYLWDSDVALESSQTSYGKANAGNGGFASGHSTSGISAAAAMAYAMPERFQEFYLRGLVFGESRIVLGVHSPFDVVGGRMLALASVAANLYSQENTDLADTHKNSTLTADFKTATREQALSVMMAAAVADGCTGCDDSDSATAWKAFYEYLHSGQDTDSSASDYDKFADHDANKAEFESLMTIGLADQIVYATDLDPVVPKGAEVLLETRYPYLSDSQRRVVLKTTEFASGYPVMTDAEGWGRLDMFKAGDGYGAFNGLVTIDMDSASCTSVAFCSYDLWRNDISGTGKLKLEGDGTLELAGSNTYSGGTEIAGGTLEAGSTSALGNGDVYLGSGALLVSASEPLAIKQKYTQLADTTLQVTIGADGQGRIEVGGLATIQGGTLSVKFASGYTPTAGSTIEIITAGTRHGKFTTVSVEGWNATASYTSTGVSVKLVSASS